MSNCNCCKAKCNCAISICSGICAPNYIYSEASGYINHGQVQAYNGTEGFPQQIRPTIINDIHPLNFFDDEHIGLFFSEYNYKDSYLILNASDINDTAFIYQPPFGGPIPMYFAWWDMSTFGPTVFTVNYLIPITTGLQENSIRNGLNCVGLRSIGAVSMLGSPPSYTPLRHPIDIFMIVTLTSGNGQRYFVKYLETQAVTNTIFTITIADTTGFTEIFSPTGGPLPLPQNGDIDILDITSTAISRTNPFVLVGLIGQSHMSDFPVPADRTLTGPPDVYQKFNTQVSKLCANITYTQQLTVYEKDYFGPCSCGFLEKVVYDTPITSGNAVAWPNLCLHSFSVEDTGSGGFGGGIFTQLNCSALSSGSCAVIAKIEQPNPNPTVTTTYYTPSCDSFYINTACGYFPKVLTLSYPNGGGVASILNWVSGTTWAGIYGTTAFQLIITESLMPVLLTITVGATTNSVYGICNSFPLALKYDVDGHNIGLMYNVS